MQSAPSLTKRKVDSRVGSLNIVLKPDLHRRRVVAPRLRSPTANGSIGGLPMSGQGSPCGRSATSQRQPSPGRSSWMPTTITPRGQRGPAGVIRASGQHDRQGDGGRLIQQLGFAAVDTGGLASGWRPRRPGTPVYGTDQRRAQGRAALALWPVPLRQERVRSQGGGGRRPGWPRIAARSGRSCSWPWPPAATASPSSIWHGDAGPDRCLSGRAAAGPQEGDVRGIAGAAALRPTGYRWCMERSRCAAGSRHREEARC